ncbi:class I SAM-dependent methyltransferase [Methylobacterium oxalidis]|uniref:class I SAM-dependent methyltransferase n=1 Tax=Methylobacterium oxalidis TaxID=944322 RepID=UPI003314B5B2
MSLTLREIAKKHDAKKDDPCLDLYTEKFETLRDQPLTFLEMGVQGGGSVKMWSEFFPNARIIGIDLTDFSEHARGDRIEFFQGRQEDAVFLDSICEKTGIDQFDVILDDASHFGLYTKRSYEILFDRRLKRGGFYIIEDWGTGYWDDWPDGSRYQAPPTEVAVEGQEAHFIYRPDEAVGLLPKTFHSHQFGMVGFIKQLVDEAHHGAIKNAHPYRLSKFDSMIIKEGVVLITKK